MTSELVVETRLDGYRLSELHEISNLIFPFSSKCSLGKILAGALWVNRRFVTITIKAITEFSRITKLDCDDLSGGSTNIISPST